MMKAPKNRSVDELSLRKDRGVVYIGHKPEIVVNTDGPSYIFKNGEARTVPAALADSLLKQPDKFKEE